MYMFHNPFGNVVWYCHGSQNLGFISVSLKPRSTYDILVLTFSSFTGASSASKVGQPVAQAQRRRICRGIKCWKEFWWRKRSLILPLERIASLRDEICSWHSHEKENALSLWVQRMRQWKQGRVAGKLELHNFLFPFIPQLPKAPWFPHLWNGGNTILPAIPVFWGTKWEHGEDGVFSFRAIPLK